MRRPATLERAGALTPRDRIWAAIRAFGTAGGIWFSVAEIMVLSEQRADTVLSYLTGLIEKALGKKAVIDRQPPQPGDVPITYANIAKARAKLGYNPKVKIEEGIPKFVDWFLKERKS